MTELYIKRDKGFDQLPSQQAVKSVQGANQARQDVRLEAQRARRASMTKRLSGVNLGHNGNKVAPENANRKESVSYARPSMRRRMSSITTDEALMLQRDMLQKLMAERMNNAQNINLGDLGFDVCHTEEEQLVQLKRLKDMPCPIAVKRMLRARLMNQEVKSMKGWAGWKIRRQRERKRIALFWTELTYKLEWWQGSFKEIEGHFGTGVVSYFVFLKWLFQLDLIILTLLIIFIIIPQAALSTGTSVYAEPCVNSTSNLYSNIEYFGDIVTNCSADYQNYVASTSGTENGTYSAVSYIVDFIQGRGFMENTYLFYGFYSDSSLDVNLAGVSNFVKSYNLPFAYILVTVVYFMISLIMMVKQSAQGFRETIVSTDNKFYQFCNKAFGTWDFALNDTKNVILKKKSIYQEILHDLNEQRDTERRESRTTSQNCRLWSVRILVNIFVITALGCSGYLIYYVTQRSSEIINSWPEYQGWNSALQLAVEFMPSLTLTALNIILPAIFEKIVQLEDYTPKTEVQLNLLRTVFLRLASLVVLFATLYVAVTCSTKDSCNVGTGGCQALYCWETNIGQQLYKLVITDFATQIIIVVFVEFPRKLIVSKCDCMLAKKIGYQQFIIPKNVLNLVYSQTLCWLGAFFSPLIPLLCTAEYFVAFYAQKLSLLSNYVPNDRPYRASRSNSFFVIILLASYVLCLFPIIYVIAVMTPSRGCGPFKPYRVMYEAMVAAVCEWPAGFQSFLTVVSSVSFTIPVTIILCLTIYYQSIAIRAHRQKTSLLKDQLLMEHKDKQFLLNKLNELQKGSKGKTETIRQQQQTLTKREVSGTDKLSTAEVIYEEDRVSPDSNV